VWKPFLEEYYAKHPWPEFWTQPPGVITRMVCGYDGGHISSGGYNEIFLQGIGEPTYPCGTHPPPGAAPYAPPSPSPSPNPSATPTAGHPPTPSP